MARIVNGLPVDGRSTPSVSPVRSSSASMGDASRFVAPSKPKPQAQPRTPPRNGDPVPAASSQPGLSDTNKKIFAGTSLQGMNRVPDVYQARERLIRSMTPQAEMQMDPGARADTASGPNVGLYAGIKNKAIAGDRFQMAGMQVGPGPGVSAAYMLNDLF